MTCSACGETLCDLCLARELLWLGSEAHRIGHAWARAVKSVIPDQPWPSWDESERIREIARRKVAKLGQGDERLLDRLAKVCAASARHHYEHDTPIREGELEMPRDVAAEVDLGDV